MYPSHGPALACASPFMTGALAEKLLGGSALGMVPYPTYGLYSDMIASTLSVSNDDDTFLPMPATFEIRIEFQPDESELPMPFGPGNSGCTTCKNKQRPEDSSSKLQVGKTQDQTMPFYGSIFNDGTTDKAEVNSGGFWQKVGSSDAWICTSGTDMYVMNGNTCTDIVFDVTHTSANRKYHYARGGPWSGSSPAEARANARSQTEGRIPLIYVQDTSTNITREQYVYDTTNNRATCYLRDSTGTTAGYAVYGGVDYTDPQATVSRIWTAPATEPLSNYKDRTSGNPDGTGRWVDIDCEFAADGTALVTKVQQCSSCAGGGQKSYDYVGLNVGREEGVATQFAVQAVKDASGSILARYDYDSRDRVRSTCLGNYSGRVTEWAYRDKEIQFVKNSSGQTIAVETGVPQALRRDFVDNERYRATLYIYDDNGRVVEERKYHELQTNEFPSGPCSPTVYQYDTDASGYVTKKTTIVHLGHSVVEEYDSLDHVTKRYRQKRGDSAEYLVEQDTYSQNEYSCRYDLLQSIDRNQATTVYQYNSDDKVITKVDPNPADGGPTGLATAYAYDTQKRLTTMIASGTRNLTTQYLYDGYDRVTKEIASGLTTSYAYDFYGQVTQVDKPNGQIVKTFYNTSTGALIGEGVYVDGSTVASAWRNMYDSNGRIITKSVVNEAGTFSAANLITSMNYTSWPTNPSLSWSHEVYQYDGYGRKTGVIALAGTGGQNLTTSYEYDNQSDVTRVTKPDGSSTTTIRDGRGLPQYQISTANTKSATTSFYYNANGNLIKKKDPEGVSEYYDYDEFDRQIRVRRGRGS